MISTTNNRKKQIENWQATIKNAQEQIAGIREQCPHEHTEEGLYCRRGDGSAAIPAIVCSECGQYIDHKYKITLSRQSEEIPCPHSC